MSSSRWLKPKPENTSQSELRRLQMEKAARAETPSHSEPVRDADPSAEQTRPPVEPVSAMDPAPRSEQTRSPAEPVRHTDGFMPFTNHLLDDILPTLDPSDQAVLVRLYRLTRGFDNNSVCRVSRKKLVAKTRVKQTRLLQALATLEDRGYIRRLPDDTSNPNLVDRGMIIEMLIEPVRLADPSAQRTRSSGGPNKKENLKRNTIKGDAARLCDRCREWNGFWYPEGIEKGVRRCDHSTL